MSLLIGILLVVILIRATDKDIIGDLLPAWQREAFSIAGLTAAYVVAGGTFLEALGVTLLVVCALWVVDLLIEIKEVISKAGE